MDDFERELNAPKAKQPAVVDRYDSFEQEGPEDAWASSVGKQNGRSAVAAPPASANSGSRQDPAPLTATRTGGTVQGSREDDDCEPFPLCLQSDVGGPWD